MEITRLTLFWINTLRENPDANQKQVAHRRRPPPVMKKEKRIDYNGRQVRKSHSRGQSDKFEPGTPGQPEPALEFFSS